MYFKCKGNFYLQIGGTAMGMALTLNYANLFVDKFKTKALEKYPLQHLIWKRFIDDIFMIWAHGEQKLHKFIEYLNNIHPAIKFTHEFSKTDVNFFRYNSQNKPRSSPVNNTVHETN